MDFLNQFDFRYLSRTLNFSFSSKNLLLPLDLRTIFYKDMIYLHLKARISCSLQNLKNFQQLATKMEVNDRKFLQKEKRLRNSKSFYHL